MWFRHQAITRSDETGRGWVRPVFRPNEAGGFLKLKERFVFSKGKEIKKPKNWLEAPCRARKRTTLGFFGIGDVQSQRGSGDQGRLRRRNQAGKVSAGLLVGPYF
jgi:hypothetical protein